MDTLETIRTRRSLRKFRPDPLPDDILHEILSAATLAPSGKNAQPWRFAVMRAGIAARKAEDIPSGSSEWLAKVMEQAPVVERRRAARYADEIPSARPRKPLDEVARWL